MRFFRFQWGWKGAPTFTPIVVVRPSASARSATPIASAVAGDPYTSAISGSPEGDAQ